MTSTIWNNIVRTTAKVVLPLFAYTIIGCGGPKISLADQELVERYVIHSIKDQESFLIIPSERKGKKLAILIDEEHLLRLNGFYSELVDDIVKITPHIGLEGAEYGEHALGSLYRNQLVDSTLLRKLTGRPLTEDQMLMTMILGDSLGMQLAKKKDSVDLFGLEDLGLYATHFFQDKIIRAYILGWEDIDSTYTHNLYQDLKQKGLDTTLIPSPPGEEHLGSYVEKLLELSDTLTDRRTEYAAEVVTKEANKHGLIAVIYGGKHIPLLKELLEEKNISVIEISNQRIERYKAIEEILKEEK